MRQVPFLYLCLFYSCLPSLHAQDEISLQNDNLAGEDWNTARAWASQARPDTDHDYVVENDPGSLVRSPQSPNPTFLGRTLAVRSGGQLLFEHSGIATIPFLALESGAMQALSQCGITGSRCELLGSSALLIADDVAFEAQAPLVGSGSFEVFATPAPSGNRASTIRFTGSGSNYTGDWIAQGALLHFVAPGSFGSGNLILSQGQVDFDYNVSAPDSSIIITGDGFHIFVDQEIVVKHVRVEIDRQVVLDLPPGAYSTSDLVNQGFSDLLVSGDGTLYILDATLDSDGDGLLDSWERQTTGNLSQSSESDGDGDGLSMAEEFERGTNPRQADTDNDGLDDSAETQTGFFVSPNNTGSDPSNADSDGDGLNDGEEVTLYASSPVLADTDSDGLSDREEVLIHLTKPNLADSDADGQTDRDEVAAGTNPNDAASTFTLVQLGAVRFEESDIGANAHVGLSELSWSITAPVGAPATVDNLDGSTLPSRQLLLNNGSMTWSTSAIPLGGYSHVTASIDARVYQTSTGIESDDFIDISLALSRDGGQTFPDQVSIIALEGTRTGAAGLRAPLEEALSVTDPADGPFVTFASDFGDIPNDATHLQVRINATNNSTSERFLFDNIIIKGISLVDPNVDTDGDGLTDLAEAQNGLDAMNPMDASEDADGDGLTNLEEFRAGTQILKADSDGDGLSDHAEIATHKTDPLNPDTDGDTLRDGAEVATYQTDPLKPDTDGDSYNDALEVSFGSNPTAFETNPPFGPQGALAFIWFEESPLGATSLTNSTVELGWQMAPVNPSGQGVIDTLDTAPLPDKQLFMHNGALSFLTDPVPLARPESTVVSVDVRVYQTSSGIESEDYIDLAILTSADGGLTYSGTHPFLSVEGTRTGATGVRAPMEDVLQVDTVAAPADGPFVTFTSPLGLIPKGTTHIRVSIQSLNNSTSERFVFDNIVIREEEIIDPQLDRDNDGLPDAFEVANGLNRDDGTDALADTDGDGLTNLREFELGSDPRHADTDRDGITDGQEVSVSLTNPLVADSDGDRLDDLTELTSTHTDPNEVDTDNDGLNDGTEVAFGRDPLVAEVDTHVGPANAAAFTWFETSPTGATRSEYDGVEMGWTLSNVVGTTLGVTNMVDSVDLPNHAFYLNNAGARLTSDPVKIDSPDSAIASIDARVYQISTGIESEDYIDLIVQTSTDGVVFRDSLLLVSVEGTRTGASGGPRTALEDVFETDAASAPADGAFRRFASAEGALPSDTQYIRVVIDAQNNSASEFFIFDNIVISGTTGSVSNRSTRPFVSSLNIIRIDNSIRLTWPTERGFQYALEASPSLTASTWTTVASAPGDGNVGIFNETVTGTLFFRLMKQPE